MSTLQLEKRFLDSQNSAPLTTFCAHRKAPASPVFSRLDGCFLFLCKGNIKTPAYGRAAKQKAVGNSSQIADRRSGDPSEIRTPNISVRAANGQKNTRLLSACLHFSWGILGCPSHESATEHKNSTYPAGVGAILVIHRRFELRTP